MRIIRNPSPRRKWSHADRARAAELVIAGASNNDIAKELGRQPDAVRAWIHHFKLRWKEPEPVDYPMISVQKAEIPDWYLLGWRFVGFAGALCVLEWRASQEPKYLEQRAAA